MKKTAYVIFAVLLLIVFTSGVSKSTGPPGCHAGELPNNMNCTSCHTGVINQGAAQVDMNLNGAETAYVPGQVYTFTISVKKPGLQVAGFQFIAQQNNNVSVSPGTITLTDPARTQKVDVNNPHVQGCLLQQKVWVEHTFQGIASNPQGESTWSFQWKAPETNVGSITFYLAALETNNSGDELGDNAYTRSVTSSAVVNIAEETEALKTTTKVFFEAVQNKIKISSNARTIKSIEVWDSQGRMMIRPDNFEPESLNHTIDVNGLTSGLYLVKISTSQYSYLKKILIYKQ